MKKSLFELHKHNVRSGKVKSSVSLLMETEGFKIRLLASQMKDTDRFVKTESNDEPDEETVTLISKVLTKLKPVLKQHIREDMIMTDKDNERSEAELLQLGVQFCDAVKNGDEAYFEEYLRAGLSVNVSHPQKLMTPLHIAAGGSQYFTEKLMATGKCDYLLTDKWGRLACDLACIGNVLNEDTTEQLFDHTGEQLQEQHGMNFEQYTQAVKNDSSPLMK